MGPDYKQSQIRFQTQDQSFIFFIYYDFLFTIVKNYESITIQKFIINNKFGVFLKY